MSSDQVTFSAETFGDYRWDKRNSKISLGEFYERIIEDRQVNGMNLHEGIEDFVDEFGKEKLESILAFIEKIAKPGQSLKEVIQADFVCRRAMLRNLAMTDYNNEPYTFLAVRLNGVIFLCEEKETNYDYLTRGQLNACYYGVKFEQIMTDLQPTSSTPVNHIQARTVLHGIFKNSEDEHSVLYSGEVDGVDYANRKVELKLVSGPLGDYWIDNKSLTWYLQSYFAKIEKIIVGERRYSTIERVYPISTADIPKLANNTWSPTDCLKCLHSILSDVKKWLATDGSAQRIRYYDENFTHEDVLPSSLGILTPSFISKFTD